MPTRGRHVVAVFPEPRVGLVHTILTLLHEPDVKRGRIADLVSRPTFMSVRSATPVLVRDECDVPVAATVPHPEVLLEERLRGGDVGDREVEMIKLHRTN